MIDDYEKKEAAKAARTPSKKKREDWDKIEVEMGDDWDSVKDRLKAEMAAAKGTSRGKRKAAPYSPLYAAGLAHDRAALAECMTIVNAAHANASSLSLFVPPRGREIMEPLLKRQVKLFRFRKFLGYSINGTLQKLSEMVPPKLSDIPGIRSSSRNKVHPLRASVVQSLDSSSSQETMSQNKTALANQAACDRQNPERLTKIRVLKQATLGSYFKMAISAST